MKRKGWIDHGIESNMVETVGSHSYGVGFLIILLDSLNMIPSHFSKEKLFKIALLHDLPESIVGDITPRDGISRRKKESLERDAVNTIFGEERAWDALKELLLDYIKEPDSGVRVDEYGYIQQLDKLDMMIQAILYEKHLGVVLNEFYDDAEHILKDGRIKQLFNGLMVEGKTW
ncbi:MAG: HD domain-containing protein [Promethearchaeota archaeon]